jgi:hypothetical protein
MDKSFNDNFSVRRHHLGHHHLGLKTGIRVHIPKRLGRVMPKVIKTDHFNFASIADSINNISNTVQQVSNAAGQAVQTYGQIQTALKNPPAITHNTPAPSAPAPTPVYPVGQIQMPMNTNVIVMVVGGLLVLVIVGFFLRKKI